MWHIYTSIVCRPTSILISTVEHICCTGVIYVPETSTLEVHIKKLHHKSTKYHTIYLDDLLVPGTAWL